MIENKVTHTSTSRKLFNQVSEHFH